MTSTSDMRLTRVKMHVANRLTRVQCRTRVKMHVTICSDFCSVGIVRLISKLLDGDWATLINVYGVAYISKCL